MNRISLSGLLLFVYLFFVASSDIIAQNTTNERKKSLIMEASYIGDNLVNFSGGIKTGYAYLGLANIRIRFDFENAGLWKGALLQINGANTHGATPSADYLGDFQVASNIEAGNHTFFQELWYRQILGKFEITAGLQDLNVEFVTTEHGALYLNSSFGTLPVISGNIRAPIFPLTSLGLTAKWNISENFSWLAAVYDGSPTDFDFNPYNIKWEFTRGDGLLVITEIQRKIEIKEHPGIFKMGVVSHNHIISDNDPGDSVNYSYSGLFFHADQNIIENSRRSIGAFLQIGYSPSEKSSNKSYIGLGVNLSGFLSRSKNEVLGLAVAHAGLGGAGCETTLELTWQKQIFTYLYIQPDIQYIINPSGRKSNIDNCLAAFIRFGLAF